MPLHLLTERDVRAVVPSLPEVVALVEEAYRLDAEGKVEVPTKIGVHPSRANSFLHAMPAWVDGARALGMKWVSYFPGNLDSGLPDSTGLIILNDPDRGQPCCIMEGMHVTFLRTAACAAVAAKYLVPQPPITLGLIGCGGLGLWSLRIMGATFPSIERVLVSSKTRVSREAFCSGVLQEGRWTLKPVDDPLDAVSNADIVVSSLPPGSDRPVTGHALRPGAIFIPLDLTSAWQDDMLFVADIVAADNPVHFAAQVRGKRNAVFPILDAQVRIQDLVIGKAPRASGSNRSVVAVCGIASTDVVVGWEIYRRARAAGIGLAFDMQG
jgi:alanine dehydrogenase